MYKILKKNRKMLVCMLFAAFAVYSVMITNELTNTYDGLWNGPYNMGGGWENSLGRYLIPVLDSLHLGVDTEPFTSIASLFLFVLGDIIIIEMLCPASKMIRSLAGLLLIVNTAVSVSLSYRFTALVYAAAFLCSVAGAYYIDRASDDVISRKGIVMAAAGILLTAGSLAFYQAYIGCTLVILTFAMIEKMAEAGSFSRDFIKYISELIMAGAACILYYAGWCAVLYMTGTERASYNGADHTGAETILSALPADIRQAYRSFFSYYLPGNAWFENMYQNYRFHTIIIMSAAVICTGVVIIRGMRISRKIMSAALLFLMPVFANLCLLLAPGSAGLAIQMSMPMAIVLPCAVSVTAALATEIHISSNYRVPAVCLKWIYTGLICVVLIGSLLIVSADQHEMRQTRQTSENLMNRIVYDIESDPKLHGSNVRYVFAGRPADNALFSKDQVYGLTNSYAHYGDFWTGGNCLYMSYSGLLRDCGINISLPDAYTEYNEVLKKSEVRAMPSYPAEDSIKMVDGYCVVKISD